MLSVFTPSHRATHLDECFASLRAQTYEDWEWVVLLNGGARWAPPAPDSRVRVVDGTATGLVGAAKREACALATGEVLVELDHDDVLLPTCLEEVARAFAERPDVALVYSDFTQVDEDGTPNFDRFNAANGWEYRSESIDGRFHNVCLAPEPTPNNVAYIWYAPNHVRAFRREAYEAVGGYDATLEVLDDQDLMMRLFRVGDFHRIPRCLYLQRMHPHNTQRDARINSFIQTDTVARYWDGIADLAVSWANRRGLSVLDLSTAGSVGRTSQGAHRVVVDPDQPMLADRDGSVGAIFVTDVLQLIGDPGLLFRECHRVLAPNGLLLTLTPSTDGRGAFQDHTHRTYWNENSFWYVTQAPLRDRVYPANTDVRFQVGGIRTYFPTEFDEQHDIAYVAATLLAVKDGPRDHGPLLC